MDAIKNQLLDFFKELSFEESTHGYFVKGNRLKASVSKLIKNYVTKTNFKAIAQAIDRRENLPPGTTSLFWKNKSQVALAIGNKAHFFGEMYAFRRNLKPTDGYEKAIVAFWASLPDHIIPVFTEYKMYHKKYRFGGMMDILLYNTLTGKFIIGDYKTNENLFKNFQGKTLKMPFDDLLDSPFNHYQLQFSFYQILFEQTGFEIERRILVHIKPSGTFDMYDTKNVTGRINRSLKNIYNE